LNNGGRGKYAAQDGALRLTQIVRASNAAPTYFAPEENRATLQWLTNCLTPWLADNAVGNIKLDSQVGPQHGATIWMRTAAISRVTSAPHGLGRIGGAVVRTQFSFLLENSIE
jgi:hypothetical protein